MQEYVLLFIFFKILHGGTFTAGNACIVSYCIESHCMLCCVVFLRSCVLAFLRSCVLAFLRSCVLAFLRSFVLVLKNCINSTSIFHNYPQRHVKRKVPDFLTLLTSSMFTILDKNLW